MQLFPLAIAIVLSLAALAIAGEPGVWNDPSGDAVIRRTDLGNDAPLPVDFEPIDLLMVRVMGWLPNSPSTNLYDGAEVSGDANFVRIQVSVDGLISPPGPIGLNGFAYNPYQFGDRPITGFIDLDIDDQKDSGGELMPLASSRYLANVARFSMSPAGSISERMIQSEQDLDSDFFEGPEFERTGAEFTLVMCGCFAPSIISQDGNLDSIFDSGETWVVGGRFFERFESFQPLSAMFGGGDFGLFNPTTALRFEHDPFLDQTTITLVFPITNAGAAAIQNHPVQPLDLSLSNDTSLEEALDDLIIGADFANGALGVLTNDWRDQDATDFRVPSEWKTTALIGTAPLTPQPSSFYVWTDTGFNEFHEDFNLDQLNDAFDSDTLEDYIDDNDGTIHDNDQIVNGEIGIANFGLGFHFFDTNYDGIVSDADQPAAVCQADLTGDGAVDFLDISAFLGSFTQQTPLADLNADGNWDFLDISAFLTFFAQGCP